MEKRNWKHSVTLKQRMVLCLAAFFAAFALQLALNGYQARAVQQVQDDQMGNFNAISRFQGGVESSISILEAYPAVCSSCHCVHHTSLSISALRCI